MILSRPKKYRMVEYSLKPIEFLPNRPIKGEIELSIDELEALHLADIEKMHQVDAAELMGVSRQTFGRIVDSAHSKIADAILNSKIIRTEKNANCKFVQIMKCESCGKVFRMPIDHQDHACPYCSNENIHALH